MSIHKKYSREPKKIKTRKKDEHALTNVVSLRISDQEKRLLERVTRSTSRNVSEVIREALDLWMARRRKLCLDA